MSKSGIAGPKSGVPSAPPLTPRKHLFVFLLIVLTLWLGFLIALYVATVKQRTTPPMPPPSAPLGG